MIHNLSSTFFVSYFLIFVAIFSNKGSAEPSLANVLGVGDGLPSNRVFDIERDHLGYMWLATEQGIARFDGMYVKRFSAHTTPKLTLSLKVRDLLFDKNNRLWVAGKQGLELLAPFSERFEPLTPKGQDSQLNAYSVMESQLGIIWVGTSTGLFRYSENELKPVILTLNEKHIVPHVLSLTETDTNELLLATENGVMRVNLSTLTVQYLQNEAGETVFADRVWRLSNGEIWLAIHGKGLATYSSETAQVSMQYIDENEFDTVGYVFDLLIGKEQFLAASLNTGLLTLNDGAVESHLGLPPLLSLYQDEQITAYGSFSEGVTFSSANHNAVNNQYFTHPSETGQYEINDILMTKEAIWFADQLAGLCRYSLEGVFEACLDTHDLSAQAIAQSASGLLWVSLYQSIVQIEPETLNVVRRFDLSSYHIPDSIYTIASTNDHSVWLSHSFDGVTRLNAVTKEVERFHTGNSPLKSDEVHSLVLHGDTLWVATSKGLQAFDVQSEQFRLNTSLASDITTAVYGLSVSPQGLLYIQTDIDLRVFDLKAQSWITLPDKIKSLTDTSIAFDDAGFTWFASSHGLMRWSREDKKTPVRHFDKGDGLYPQGYLGGAGDALNRKIVFAAPDGLSLFYPEKFDFADASPKVSEFELTFTDGKTQSYFNQINLPVLPYDHASIRFVLANTNFSSAFKQQFKYKLEGVADTWVELGKSRVLMIPKLAHGKYTLLLKSTDSDGNWSDNIGRFSFVIQTPWYLTIWAFCFYGLLSLLILFIVYRARIRTLRRIQIALEKEVATQTQEISKQNKLLIEKTEALADAQAQRSALLRTLSHELMTPVSLIQGPAEQLIKVQHSGERSKMANIVVSNAKRLKVLIQQLMQVSNVNQASSLTLEQAHVPITNFSLSQICEEQVAAFQPLAAQRSIKLTVSIEQQIYVQARPDQLEQCVSNLLSNAVKYSHDGGEVVLNLELLSSLPQSKCRLRVKDFGIGIEAAEQKAIFSPEYRTENGRMQNVGLGIGLSVVKSVMDELNGTVEVHSELGSGSEFSLTFDMVSSVNPPPLNKAQPNKLHDISDKTILIVDDTPDMLTLLQSVFSADYKVELASDGMQGAKMAKELLPDLIISDVMMPKLDGFGLLSMVKQDPLTAHIPVILLTANLNEQKELEGLSRQADDYITKPFSVQALELKVRNVFIHHAASMAKWHARIEKPTKSSADDLPMLPKLSFKDEPHIYDFLDKLDGVIHKCYQDPDIGVPELAKEMALSERQLHRKLTAVMSMGANEYLRNYRLYQSITPLLHGKSVAEVADMVGFNSSSYFSACFKKHYGLTAKSYVQKQREKHKPTKAV